MAAGLSKHPGFPQDILDVIRSHHEHWGGETDRLAGTDLPMATRIFVMCDMSDAQIGDRVYVVAWRFKGTSTLRW